MSIPHTLYDHPIVWAVIQDAYRRIESWTVSEHPDCHEAKRLLTSGWDGVALMEILADPLLELRGITAEDIDAWDLMTHGVRVTKHNRGSLYEEWDMERARARAEDGNG